MAELISKSLKTRLASGFILAPLILFVIIYGSWIFAFMVGTAALIAFYEWYGLAVKGKNVLANILTGFFYTGFCFSAFLYTRYGFEQGAWLTLCMVLCVWASDIGAYFVGKTVGGPKLAPLVSPKKTVSGLGGAMFFGGLSLVLLFFIEPYIAPYMPTVLAVQFSHLWIVFLSGCVFGFIGQAGDLFISAMKRRVGVKDTGNLIPGHGGILDRIDALMLVSPAFLSFAMLWAF